MIENDLFDTLKSIAPTYPIKLPQGVSYPAITYFVVYDGVEQCLQGSIFGRAVRIQVDIWSKSYSEVKSLKDQVIAKIADLGGAEMSVQDSFEDEIEIYREIIDFNIRR